MAASLNGFDWVVVSLVALLAIIGLMRGFTHEALSLAGWILAASVVRFFHEGVTRWLSPHTGGEVWAAIIAFLVLFFGTVLVAGILAGLAGGYARRSMLGPMDRFLGFGFGALKGVILASVLFLMIAFATSTFHPERQLPEWLATSRSAPLLDLSARAMVGWVHELRREDGDLPARAGDAPDGGPSVFGLPPGHPPVEPEMAPEAEGGYSFEDRRALDRLLEEGAKEGGQVEI